jgi:hypothetical protein
LSNSTKNKIILFSKIPQQKAGIQFYKAQGKKKTLKVLEAGKNNIRQRSKKTKL